MISEEARDSSSRNFSSLRRLSYTLMHAKTYGQLNFSFFYSTRTGALPATAAQKTADNLYIYFILKNRATDGMTAAWPVHQSEQMKCTKRAKYYLFVVERP